MPVTERDTERERERAIEERLPEKDIKGKCRFSGTAGKN